MKKYKVNEDDLTYVPEVESAIRRRGHRFAFILSVMVFAFVVIAIAWADNAILDEVTQGQGQVIPSSRIQVIQNLEGGILADVMVQENQIVEKGQILVRIDNISAQTDLRDARSQYLAISATIARLEAEATGKKPVFPDDVKKQAPQNIAKEMIVYNVNQRQIKSQINVLKIQAQQKRQEIAEKRSRLKQLRENLKLVKKQLAIIEPLVKQGAHSRVDLIKLQREVHDIAGDIPTIRLSIATASSAAKEARNKIVAYAIEAQATAAGDLGPLYVKKDVLFAAINETRDQVKRTEVRAPVRGTVKQMHLTTIGGVIKPGENIMEIVPLDDTLLIEANIRPADIAFLRPGQNAIVKITAYDFAIYGGLNAKVEQISADTIKNEEGESFYRIRLRTAQNALIHKGEKLPIIPGMVASADVLTGKKSVLDYLLKPILRAQQHALRER
jgi:adhesin transport system membrane fusion protein